MFNRYAVPGDKTVGPALMSSRDNKETLFGLRN
jgi:hypothetical protein